MTRAFLRNLPIWAICLALTGCEKNETHYYGDQQTPGVSIFSNTGNNVFSCLLDGQSWRTVNRIIEVVGLVHSTYELSIRKQNVDSLADQLIITWTGYYTADIGDYSTIELVLSVDKNFSFADFSALQGTRVELDGVTNYVLVQIPSVNWQGPSVNWQGPGEVYFNEASLDSAGINGVEGKLSGLLEASFGNVLLSSGRFDHQLEGVPIYFQ
jgi:hypothetical protein